MDDSRLLDRDPFAPTSREHPAVGALRAAATAADPTRRPRSQWKQLDTQPRVAGGT